MNNTENTGYRSIEDRTIGHSNGWFDRITGAPVPDPFDDND